MYDKVDEEGHHHHHHGLKDCSDEDRIGFVRKVYGILSFQLLLTVGVCMWPYNDNGARDWMIGHMWFFWFTAITGLVLSCVFACCQSVGRSVPINYILLTVFTLCEAYLVAFAVAIVQDRHTVLAAAFLTAGVVCGLTLYAMTTKTDYTFCGGTLFVVGAAVLMFGVISMFMGSTWRLVYCVLGVILFGMYLIFDTQLIMGGGHHQLDPEDYVLGAIMLYLDILNLFLFILRILADK